MAAGDVTAFDKWLAAQADAATLSGSPVDFDTDTIKIVVLDSTYTPDTSDTSVTEHFDDISAKEVATATSYTGPITLASSTVTLTTGKTTFDAADVTIASDAGGFTDGRYIVFYKDTGTPATSPLIAVGDLGSNQSIVTGALLLTWGANGIITWTKV